MTGLKVSPQQLSALGGSCGRTALDVRGQHAGLKSQLTPLFGAAYMAARLAGQGPDAAARAGHRLAGTVIRHRGAIIPRDAMPRG